MGIAQLIIMVAGFIGLFIYQKYKIKTLQDQIEAQERLLKNIKTFSDIINPELLKYRLEQYEKLTEKEKIDEVKEIEENLSKEMEAKLKEAHKAEKTFTKYFATCFPSLVGALCYVPQERRKTIINKMQDDDLRKVFEESLPEYEQFDRQRWPSILSILGSGGTESLKQNEK